MTSTPGPRIACTVRPWAQFPLERALAGIRTAGYDAVALPVHGVTAVVTPDTSAAEARRVGSVIADHGIELVVLSATPRTSTAPTTRRSARWNARSSTAPGWACGYWWT